MNKKIYIVLGICLILLVAGVFYFMPKSKKNTPSQLSQTEPITSGPKKATDAYEKTRTIYVGSPNAKTIINYAVHWNAKFQTEGIYDSKGNLTSKALKQYLEEYTTLHPEIGFNIRIILEDDPAQRLKLWFQNGYPIDIFQSEANSIADFVKAGMVDTPPKDVLDDIKTNYTTYQNAFYQNKIWGYPTEINTYQLVYNKDLLKEAGFSNPPKTWDELVAMAAKLTKKDSSGRILQYGIAFDKTLNWQVVEPYLALLFTNNGKFIENNQSFLNQKEAIDTLKAEMKLFENGTTNTGITTFNFQSGKVAMVLSPPWLKATFQNAFGSKFSSTVGVAPIPYISKPGTYQYGWYMGVENSSKNKEEAWKFLKWFNSNIQASTKTTRDGDFLVQTIGVIPSRKIDIQNHPKQLSDFFTAPFVKALSVAKAQQYFLHDNEIKNILRENIVLAWTLHKTAEEALNDATTKINSFLKLGE
jgi:multiple sugar transport system substrate-binding protein